MVNFPRTHFIFTLFSSIYSFASPFSCCLSSFFTLRFFITISMLFPLSPFRCAIFICALIVLSLFTLCYVYLRCAVFIHVVLSLSMLFCLYYCCAIFIYDVLSQLILCCLYLCSAISVYLQTICHDYSRILSSDLYLYCTISLPLPLSRFCCVFISVIVYD